MPLILLHPAVDLALELYVPQALEDAIAVQWERIQEGRVRQTYIRALESRLEDLLRDCLDWDLKEPTAAQIAFAKVVAQRLGIVIPPEALKFRFHMAMFLEEHKSQSYPKTRRPGLSASGVVDPCTSADNGHNADPNDRESH
jgi:hypothetical protein